MRSIAASTRRPLLLAVLLLAVLCHAAAADPAPAAGGYDVRTYGAKGDGTSGDGVAIEKAVGAAAAAGGGTVRFGAGTYLSGSIHLRSNITLFLDQGATLVAAAPGQDGQYDPPEENPAAGKFQDFGHAHWHNSLIWGENLENVSILGPGRIFGKGLTRSDDGPDGRGNKTISLKLCRNVTIRDVTIQHGGWFGILATGVDNLTIDNLKIDTNRDGMDIDCCRNVHVSNCSVNSPNDDGICLKSSYGLGFARATENVTITNCGVSGFEEGTLLDGTLGRKRRAGMGRIKFGTESNGGFKNITVSNCTFAYCNGLALETVDGGLLEDVSITNITMRDIVTAPLFLRLGSRGRGPVGTVVGALRRVNISDVIVYNADPRDAVIVSGVPGHPIEDVTLRNIQIWVKGGGTKAQAAIVPPEKEADYPEPSMFGVTPCYGFFLRHVRGITLENIGLHTLTQDGRPAFTLTDVTGLRARSADGLPDAR